MIGFWDNSSPSQQQVLQDQQDQGCQDQIDLDGTILTLTARQVLTMLEIKIKVKLILLITIA